MRELRPPAVASCFPWREWRPPYLVPSREAIDQGEGANPSCPMAGSLLVVATTVGSLLGPLLEHQPHAHTSTSTQTQAPTQIHTRTQTRAHTYASTHTNIHTKRTHTQRTPHFVGAEAIGRLSLFKGVAPNSQLASKVGRMCFNHFCWSQRHFASSQQWHRRCLRMLRPSLLNGSRWVDLGGTLL